MLIPASTAYCSISASSSSSKSRRVERADVVLELRDAAGADQGRGHARVAQRPRQRELGQRLPAALRDLVERADAREVLVAEHRLRQRAVAGRARVLGDAVEVAVGEHPLPERREDDGADALAAEDVEQVGLDPAVEQRVGGLVDEQRRAEVAQDLDRPPRCAAPSTTRCRRRAPCPGAPRCRPRRASPPAACRGRGGASRRCRRSPGPCAAGSGRGSRAGTCASPIRRRGRATCRSPPWSRSPARRATGAGPRPAGARS